jgi:hypothetical protein
VAVVCLTTLSLLVDWILTAEVGTIEDKFRRPSPTAYTSPEVSVIREMPSPTESNNASPTESNENSELLKHIPADIAASCVEDAGFKELSKGLKAAVGCEQLGPGYVDMITYLLYDSDSSMKAAYQHVVEGYTSGTLQKKSGCEYGPARGRWGWKTSRWGGLHAMCSPPRVCAYGVARTVRRSSARFILGREHAGCHHRAGNADGLARKGAGTR